MSTSVGTGIFRRRVAALVVALATMTVLARSSPALAQQGWSSDDTVLSDPMPGDLIVGAPQLAVDAAGNATAVWLQRIGVYVWIVQAARRSAGTGTWTPPVTLSVPGDFTSSPRVAVDGAGNALAVWAREGVVESSRHRAQDDAWGAVEVVAARGQLLHYPRLAMDPAGNAVVIWSEGASFNAESVQATYYTAANGSWGAVEQLSPPTTFPAPTAAMDAAGSAVAVFVVDGVVRAARYSLPAGAWNGSVSISEPGATAEAPEVDVDAAGNATAVWVRAGIVQAARLVLDIGNWTAPSDLSIQRSMWPTVVVDRAGNAIVSWIRDRLVWPALNLETRRFSAASETWSDVTTLSVGRNTYFGAGVAVDDAGNALAVWSYFVTPTDVRLHAARYVVSTDTWSSPEQVGVDGTASARPEVAFDGAGGAHAVWFALHREPPYDVTVHTRRWLATPAAPATRGIAPDSGSLAIHFDEPATPEPPFAATNYAYSLDDGLTWTTREPSSTASPWVVTGLSDLATHTVRLRALNGAGAGAVSTPVSATVGTVPGPPTGLRVFSVVRDRVTLVWTPTAGALVTGYVIEGGVNPGEVLASLPTGSLAPAFTFAAPTGAFYVRVHAVAGAVKGPPSNEIRIVVNVPEPPSPPAALRALVNGPGVSLSWTNTWTGGAPTSLWLSMQGDATGVRPLPFGERVTYDGVPPGTYVLQVVAVNASGASAPSNPVILTVPGACSGAPGVPMNVVAWRSGTTIVVAWSPPASGPAATGYTVLVTGAYTGSFHASERVLWGAAAPGTYTLRVAAANACGTGAPSGAQTVVVP